MSLEAIRNLVAHRNPRFHCESGDQTFLASLRHELPGPALPRQIQWLRERLPSGYEDLLAFYEQHDGFTLYADTRSDSFGIRLLPLGEISGATGHLREWVRDFHDDDPLQILSAYAIAEPPNCADGFYITTEGPNVGKVMQFVHDDWREEPLAATFTDFLGLIASDPIPLLIDLCGGYSRYSDGRTDTQWIPSAYTFDS